MSASTYRTGMHGQSIYVVTVRLYDTLYQPILDSKNDGKLRPTVELQVTHFGVVDLVNGTEMDDRRGCAMLFGRFEYDARGGSVGHLRGLTE